MKNKLFFFLRLFTGAVIIFALFKIVPYEKIISLYSQANKLCLFFSFLFFFLSLFVTVLRWRFFLTRLNLFISLKEAVYSSWCGFFFTFFFPSFLGGDIFRGVSLSCRYASPHKVISSLVMDRLSGGVSLLIITLFSFLLGKGYLPSREILIAIFVFSLLLALVILFIFSRTFFHLFFKITRSFRALSRKVLKLHSEIHFLKKHPKILARSIFYSFLSHILAIFSFFLSAFALGLRLNFIYFLVFIPLMMLVSSLPVTVAGAGTREAAAVFFFSLVGVKPSLALAMSLLNFIFLILVGISGGFLYVSVYYRWLQCNPQNRGD